MFWATPSAEVVLCFNVFFYMLGSNFSVRAEPFQTILIDLFGAPGPHSVGLAPRKGRVSAKKTKQISNGLA